MYPKTRFTDDRAEYEAADKSECIVYTAALYIPNRVAPMCERLRALASTVEHISELRPSAYLKLRRARNQYHNGDSEYRALVADCLKRLGDPVEGATGSDIAWFQGFTFASGMAGLLELTQAHASVTEALDRKAAYAMACFSLYVALISLTATVVLGVISLG